MRSFIFPLVFLTLIYSACTLYPYGSGTTDSTLAACDDCYSPAIGLTGFNFYGITFLSTLYVNNNGLLSFNGNVSDYQGNQIPNTNYIIAPFWADVDTRTGGTVYYRLENGDDSTIDSYIEGLFGVSFKLSSKIVATWDAVGYYNQENNLLNTFQVVVFISKTTSESITCFLYQTLNWACADNFEGCENGFATTQSNAAVAGFNADGTEFTLPNSYTNSIVDEVLYSDYDEYFGDGESCFRSTSVSHTNCFPYISCYEGPVYVSVLGPITAETFLFSFDQCYLPSPSIQQITYPESCSNVGPAYPVTVTMGSIFECTTSVQYYLPPDSIIFSYCPSDITVGPISTCQTIVNWQAPIIESECEYYLTQSAQPNITKFDIGVTEVIYNATDISGNTVYCTFYVTVTGTGPTPYLSTPSNVVATASPPSCSTAVSFNPPTVNNNCSTDFTLTSSPVSGSTFSIGSTLVTWSYSDSLGHQTSTSFDVIVTSSVFTGYEGAANNKITANTDPGLCTAAVTIGSPTVSDCYSIASTNNDLSSGNFNLGTTDGEVIVTDSNGRQLTIDYTVTVTDNQDPIITCVSVNIDAAACSYTGYACTTPATYTPPSVTDNCPNPSLLHISGSANSTDLPIGQYTDSFKAVDTSGNSQTCSLTVSIIGFQLLNSSITTTPTFVFGDTITYQILYYSPTDTQARFIITEQSTGSVIRNSLITLASTTSVSQVFDVTSVAGTYIFSLVGVTSGITSVGDPTIIISTVASASVTRSLSSSATLTSSPTSLPSSSISVSAVPSVSPSRSRSLTPTVSPSTSVAASKSLSSSPTISVASKSPTRSSSISISKSAIKSVTRTKSFTPSRSPTISISPPASAPNLIGNPSFEYGVSNDVLQTFAPDLNLVLGEWTTDSGHLIDVAGNGYEGVDATNGNNFLVLNNNFIYQRISSSPVSSQSVTITFNYRSFSPTTFFYSFNYYRGGSTFYQSPNIPTTTSWQSYSNVISFPSEGSYTVVTIFFDNTNSVNVFLDNVSLSV